MRHKKFVDNKVETADLIIKNKNKYFFIHAKKGFDCSIAVLKRQIGISGITLGNMIKINEKRKLENLWTRMRKEDFSMT